jgi:hypothetical protein
MTSRISGNIPKTICLFRKEVDEKKQWWARQYRFSEETLAELAVTHARPCDIARANDKKRIEQLKQQNENERYEQVEIPNTEFNNVRVLETPGWRRGDGYKVALETGDIVSMDEDALLDVLLHAEVCKGVIHAPLQFVTCGRGLSLVRVGSALHKEVSITVERQKQNVDARKLVVGGVYETPVDGQYVYLGKIDNDFVIDDTQYRAGPYSYTTHRSAYTFTYAYRKGEQRNVRGWVVLDNFNAILRGELSGRYYREVTPAETPKRLKVSYKVGDVDTSGFFSALRALLAKECTENSLALDPNTDEMQRYYALRASIDTLKQYLMRPAGTPIDTESMKVNPHVELVFSKVSW